MTKVSMTLAELAEKGADTAVVRELLPFIAH